MSNEKVRLLIRVAKQTNNDSDRKALLELADDLLAEEETSSGTDDSERVRFPIPIFRRYKGQLYEGRLLKGWRVQHNGKVYNTPSAAAVFISGHPENGWRMWKYYDETSNREEPVDRLRKR